jgi:hypothetical protein
MTDSIFYLPFSQCRSFLKRRSKPMLMSHSIELMDRLVKDLDLDPQAVIFENGDWILLEESWWYPKSLDLLAVSALSWGVSSPSPSFVSHMIETNVATGQNWLLLGFDSMHTHPAYGAIANHRKCNMVDIRYTSWEHFLSVKNSKHRMRIKEDIKEPYRVEVSQDFHLDPRFEEMLRMQEENLRRGVWSALIPYSRQKVEAGWAKIIKAICVTLPCEYVILYSDRRIAAVNITCRIGERKFYLIALWDQQFRNAGMCALAHAVKRSVEDQTLSWFDMMSGVDTYKGRYEPEESLVNYEIAIVKEKLKGIDMYPPYVIDGTLLTVQPTTMPLELQLKENKNGPVIFSREAS